ncbi:MAG TPA: HAD family hydrolase, partial [Campylobacteraceae bacterium]|nr:HAD family hydrolase [Campylobacteraceae bacterium]
MQIIIFDMDGTLIDTAEDITITVNHIRKVNHGLPPL